MRKSAGKIDGIVVAPAFRPGGIIIRPSALAQKIDFRLKPNSLGILYPGLKAGATVGSRNLLSILASLAMALFLNMGITPAYAQDTTKKKAPVYNFTIDDPMDRMSNAEYAVPVIYFPEFYSYPPYKHKDTTFTYECYDARDSILNTIKENSEIRFISLFKSFPDPVHTYVDKTDGIKKPLPISSIIRRYDRVGDDKWISVDYSNNMYSELKEYRGNIVRYDSVTIPDPVNHKTKKAVYSYYKVEKTK